MRFTDDTDTIVDHPPSEQQEDIFIWFMKGVGNLIVRARAGTGKTWTILKGIEFAPERSILVAAFSKDIQLTLEEKLTNPAAVSQTVHSVGLDAIRIQWPHIRKEENNGDREKELARRVCEGTYFGKSEQFLVAKLLTKARELVPLVTEGRLLAEMTEEQAKRAVDVIVDVATDFDLMPESWSEMTPSQLAAKVLQAMELALEPTAFIDYADMIYLPLRLGWLHPYYELVVVDEAQDMTVAQLEILKRICSGRLVLVGDDRQAIFHFRGADSRSLDRLKKELNAHELGLTTTYRCPRLVVEIAQRLVLDFEAAPAAAEGTVETLTGTDALCEAVQPGDFILSRKNAPLMPLVLRLLRLGMPARMQGRDVGRGLLTLVKRLAANKAKSNINEWIKRLRIWQDIQISRLTAMGKEEKCEGIIDKCETLYALAGESSDVADLLSRITALFADTSREAQVVCSSVHKAKGLEAENVFILRKTLGGRVPCECGHFHDWGACKKCECEVAVPDELKKMEEKNIAYVAMTRTKSKLTWVEEVG